MNSAAKLSQIIGTLADQKEDIVLYNEPDLNICVSELLKRDLNDMDGSQVKVHAVLGSALQNIHLSERLVAEVIYKLIKDELKPYHQKKLRGYIPLALNHPNISQMDYVNVLGGYLKSGFWLSQDYSHQLANPEKIGWNSENILTAIVINLPSARECFNDDQVKNYGIDYFLTQFFTVFSQVTDVNSPKIIESLNQLISKCSPQRIKRLNNPQKPELIPVLDPAWGDNFLKVKQTFLEKFNNLPYEPNPYGSPY